MLRTTAGEEDLFILLEMRKRSLDHCDFFSSVIALEVVKKIVNIPIVFFGGGVSLVE